MIVKKNIVDFTDYVKIHKQFIIFSRLEEKNTYKDYVYLMSEIMKALEGIDKGLSISKMETDYKFILLNHSFLDYFENTQF